MTSKRASYLYGDATQFPLPYDALATIRGLAECVAVVGRLHSEIGELHQGLVGYQETTDALLAELASIATDVATYIETRAKASTLPAIEGHAAQIAENAVGTVESLQKRYQQQLASETRRVESETTNRKRQMWQTLVPLLLKQSLTVEAATFSMWQDGSSIGLGCEYAVPGGIRITYDLEAGGAEPWTHLPRVGELAKGVDITIGMRKKVLRRSPQPERALLDTWFITAIDLRERTAEIALCRKVGQPSEQLQLSLSKLDGRVSGQVHRDPNSPGMETHAVEPEDVPRLAELWTAIARQGDQVLANRRGVRAVKLEGHDVEQEGLVVDFLERLIRYYRPIVQEIVRRTANPAELSLKIDRGGGRREEIYLAKQELLPHLAAVPEELRGRLGLSGLLPPGMTDGVPRVEPPGERKGSGTQRLGTDQIHFVDDSSGIEALDEILLDDVDTAESVG